MGRMVAKETFRTASSNKYPHGVWVAAGQVMPPKFVKKYAKLFVDETVWNGPITELPVEQASAAPGEKRMTSGQVKSDG